MVQGLFDAWVSSVANDENKSLYPLEEQGDVKLFKLQTWFWANKREKYAESPTYHVWAGDSWECATLDYQEALGVYMRTVAERTNANGD